MAEDVKAFLKEMNQKTGAQLFVLAAFERPSGNVAVTRYVEQNDCFI